MMISLVRCLCDWRRSCTTDSPLKQHSHLLPSKLPHSGHHCTLFITPSSTCNLSHCQYFSQQLLSMTQLPHFCLCSTNTPKHILALPTMNFPIVHVLQTSTSLLCLCHRLLEMRTVTLMLTLPNFPGRWCRRQQMSLSKEYTLA